MSPFRCTRPVPRNGQQCRHNVVFVILCCEVPPTDLLAPANKLYALHIAVLGVDNTKASMFTRVNNRSVYLELHFAPPRVIFNAYLASVRIIGWCGVDDGVVPLDVCFCAVRGHEGLHAVVQK